MKLQDLIKQITPLPRVLPKRILGRFTADQAYECHAANQLPKLIEAMDGLIKEIESGLELGDARPRYAEAVAALAEAQEVKI